MLEAHRHVNKGAFPTEAHFGAVAGHLQATLEELGVGEEDIGEVMALVATTKDDVCGLSEGK